MFSFLETLVILIVAVLVFGPKRLPEVARKVGNWMGMLRRASDEFKQQLMTMDQAVENAVSVPEEDLDNLLPNEEDLYGTSSEPYEAQTPQEPYFEPPPPVGEDETTAEAAAAWLDGTDDDVSERVGGVPADAAPVMPAPEAPETADGEDLPAAASAAVFDTESDTASAAAASAPSAQRRPSAPRRPTLTPTLTPTKSAGKEAAHV